MDGKNWKAHNMRFEKSAIRAIFPVMKNKLTAKTFEIIDFLLRTGAPLSIRELSAGTGIERSACWRIVSDLCELGYLRKSTYRSVEPGLGMVFLGQAAFAKAFFSHKAVAELSRAGRELGVNAAIAGIYHDHVVYFYRDGGKTETYNWPLFGSNIGLCILAKKFGAVRTKKILYSDAKTFVHDRQELARIRETVERRVEHVLKYGYAVDENRVSCNISYPLERNGEVFGLAFFFEKGPSHSLSRLITKCSLLRNALEK